MLRFPQKIKRMIFFPRISNLKNGVSMKFVPHPRNSAVLEKTSFVPQKKIQNKKKYSSGPIFFYFFLLNQTSLLLEWKFRNNY
jgi:hypothetical protein